MSRIGRVQTPICHIGIFDIHKNHLRNFNWLFENSKRIKYSMSSIFWIYRAFIEVVIEYKTWCINGSGKKMNRIHCNEMNYSMGILKCKTSDNFLGSFPSRFSRFALNFRWNLKFGKLLRLPSCTSRNRSLRIVFSTQSFLLAFTYFFASFLFLFKTTIEASKW